MKPHVRRRSFVGAGRCAATITCWGNNAFGQLGDDSTIERPRPVLVTGLADAVDLATGTAHSCAVRRDGSVVCWGDNSALQVSPAAASLVRTPTRIDGVIATRVVAGDQHTCALSTGSVVCWGDNVDGQLGAGDFSPRTPTVVVRKAGGTRLDGVEGLSTLSNHTCALALDGTLRCWGRGTHGQLGDGQTANRASATVVLGTP